MVMAAKVKEGRDRLIQLLEGNGIEIGALHRPVYAPHLKVSYVDRLTKSEALEHYPELTPHAAAIVDPSIIDDAEVLAKIANGSQDFVIANHVVEHMRDPIGALLTWARVLKPEGRLFLAVPNKENTFDKERPLTPMEHLIEDHKAVNTENDYQHFCDFAKFVSCRTFNVRPESESETFAKYLWDTNYSIHYHVWTYNTFNSFLDSVMKLYSAEFPMQIIESYNPKADEFVYVLEKQRA